MGDAQSAQREGMKDEAGEEESGKVDDAQAETSPEDKPFKNIGQISEINEKAGSSIAEVNNHCEDEIATDAVLTPDEEVSQTENPLEEETPSKPIEKNEIESSNEADVAEDVSLDMTEMDAKTNDINEGFRRFFSNIGLRLSIKRGSTDLLRDLPDETNDANANDANDEPSGQENFEDSAEEIQMEDAEQNTDVNIAQVSTDNDSTACPTITDVTPEDVLENAEEKATEAKEDVESDNADESAVEESHQDTTPEEESNLVSPPEHEEVVSPIKRFFTTGIFSGLRKKRKAVEDDVNEKEMVDMGKKETVEFVEETEYNQQEEKEKIDPGVEAAVVDTEHTENETKQEILTVTSAKKVDEGKSPTTDHSTAIDTTMTTVFPESETLNSQEKDKVQASPLKRLLSGSSFKKLSKKPRSRRSSDSKLSDSGEHAADQLLSSTESTENQEEEKSTQPSLEAAGQEDGAWVSFKKLLTPKKHTRTTSLSNKETEFPDSVEEPKPTDGEQISDHSTEEGKKRKDSSVSWEAVLCRSGKKRSRKTSDSEDESPQIDDNKQEVGSKNGSELPEERANEKKNDVSVSSPKQSPSIGDGGSTWKSFKRLVTPKRKVKDEDEGKDNIQSDSEVSQDESSFSIKKLLPGRKKRKSTEKQDHASSDEIDKDVPSDDEDSETPAVVPMSEFDAPQSLVQIQTQVDIVSHFPKEVSQDLLHQMAQPVLPCESLQNEGKKLEENVDALDNGTSIMTAKIEQLDVSEIISKHQQLSDITEEGIITETMATPVSINEEVGRDDTLAEDLLEITSEAITAPEPASVTTLADETEMISAVSQLSSESSKTSGNTTPVPAEYEVKETEKLLHQVVENISTSPMAVTISSAPPKSESIVGSVLHHIFRTFVKEDKETTILEIQEVDAVNDLAAKAQIEIISAEAEHILEAEVITTVQEAQLDSRTTNLSLDIQEPEVLLSDVNDSVKDIKTEEGASTGMQVVTECTEEGSETIPPTEGNLEPEDPSKIYHVKEAEESQTAQQSLLGQLMRSLLPQKKVLSDDLSQKETVTDEPQPETELKVEPERKLQDKGAKIDDNQEPEVLPFDGEDSVKDFKTNEGVSTGMQVVPECTKEGSETIPHTEGSLEPEDPSKTDHVEEPEESQTAQQSLLGQLMRSLLPQSKVLSEDLSQKETVPDEPQPETEVRDESEQNLPVEAKHIPEAEVITAVQEAQLDSKTTNLSFEKVLLEGITALQIVRDESQQETEVRLKKEGRLQAKGAKIDDNQEPEVLLSDVDDSVKDFKTEEGSSTGMQVLTECTEESSETIPHTKGSLESEDPSKTDHVEEPEESQTAQESLFGQLMHRLLPQKQVLSDDLSQKETVTDEPQPETEVKDESEENLPVNAKHIPEAEVITTVQEAQLDLMTTNLSLEKVIVEDITGLETVREKPQNVPEWRIEPEEKLQIKGAQIDDIEEPEVFPSDVKDSVKDIKIDEGSSTDMQVVTECTEDGNEIIPHTEGSLELEDTSRTDYVEESEELQTPQQSLLGQLMRSLLPQKKVLSDDLSQKETVPDEPQKEREVRDDSEENLSVEAEHIPEAEVITAVQEAQLDSKTTNLSFEKVLLEDITALETVRDEPQQETEVRLKKEGKLQAKGAKIDDNQEPEVLLSDVDDSVKDFKTEEGSSTGMQVVTECTEESSETIPHTKGSLESQDPSKTDHVEEPEESQTAQESLFGQLIRSLLPQKKVLSDDLSQKETVTDEPQPETEGKDESEENLPVNAKHIPEAEVITTVQEAQLDSMTTNLSLEKVIVEDITGLETVREKPQNVPEWRVEPEEKLQVKGAQIDDTEEPEVFPSDIKDSVRDIKIEEGSSTGMQVVPECTEEGRQTIPHTEGSLEPKDPLKMDHVEEPEESQTAQRSLLGQLMRSLLPQKKLLSDELSQNETVPEEPQQETEGRDESAENLPVEAEHIPEAEVKITVQEVQVDSMTTNLSLEKIIVEDITALETVRDEPQQETEVRLKPEGKLQAKGAETDENQEPEVLISSVEDSFKDLKTEEGASTDMQVVTECTEEGSETIPHTEGSLEPEDPSKTDHIEEPQESQTAQESLFGQLIRSLLPQKKVLSDDLSQKETVTGEPQPETEGKDESEENLPVNAKHIPEAEVITTVQEAQLDSMTTNLSLEKVIVEDITGLETVREKPQNVPEWRIEPEEKLQAKGAETDDIEEPEVFSSDVKDSVKDIKTEEGSSTGMQVVTEYTEEGSETIPHTEGSLEPEDPSKTDHVEEPEESQTAQQSVLSQLMHRLLPQSKVLSEDSSQKETIPGEPQPETEVRDESAENLPVEAQHIPEAEIITRVQEGQLDSMTTNLSLEKVIVEDITALETVKDKPQNETELRVEPEGKLQSKGAETDDNQEPEVLPSDVEDSVKDLKTEKGASTDMQVLTECTEEGSETIPHTKGSLEPEDTSKTDYIEEPQESQTAQESLFGQLIRSLLPQKKVLSDDLSQKETVTGEPQPETEGKDESEENLPVNAKHIPEAEVITTVQEAQLDSMTTNLSLEKVIVEDITGLETVREKPQNVPEWRIEPEEKLQAKGAETDDIEEPEVFSSDVKDSVKDIKTEEGSSTGMQVVTEYTEEGSETIPHTEGSLEPEDPSKTDHVEEPEESQTAQQSVLSQLMHRLLPQSKVLSEDLLQKETIPGEPQPETEVRDESAENLPVEAQHIPEAEIITRVQERQLDSMTTNLSLEKVIVEDITALETVKDKPQNETELRVEPEGKLQSKGAETDDNQEPEVLPSDVEDSVKDLKTEKGASTDMQVLTECTEEGSETIPHTKGSLEPEDTSKTDYIEEPQESQTAQESLFGQVMHRLLPQKKVLSDDLSQKETVTDDPQPETEAKDESEENLPVESKHIPEAEVLPIVQEEQLDSMTTNLSLEKLIVEDITELETVKDEPQNVPELRIEPEEKLQAKGAETDDIEEPEVFSSDVKDSVKDIKTEEGSSTGMQVVTEYTEEGSETIPHTEGSLEPEDPSKTDHVEESEKSLTAQQSLLSQLICSLLPQTKVLSEDLLQKETIPGEPQPETEVRDESAENLPVEAEHIPEAEVITTVQEAQLDSMTTNLSFEKVLLEGITGLETVREKPQNVPEWRIEPEEKLQIKGAQIDDIEEPEVFPSDVKDSVKDIKIDEGSSTDMQVVTECTEEGSETIPHTKGSLEPEDTSKTDYIEEPQESQTAQESLFGQLMHRLLPQKQVLSDDLSQKETVTGEPQPETEGKDESEENLPVNAKHIPEAEVITTVQEAQLDSMTTNLSLEKVIVEDITALETVKDEPQNETELRVEPEGKPQSKGAETDDNQEPEVLPSDVEDSVKDFKTNEGVSTGMQVVTECTEEGSDTIPHTEGSLEPEDPSKTDHFEEPEESQTAQESLLGQPMHSLLPQKQVLSDDLSQKETVTDEPQPETEVKDESEENLPTEEKATVANSQSDEKVMLKDITLMETVCDELQKETALMVEPKAKLQVNIPKTDDVQESEDIPCEIEDSVMDTKTEGGAPNHMQVVEECTEEASANTLNTITQKEDNLEPVDSLKTDFAEEPEVQESLLGLLMNSLLPNKVLSDVLSPKEKVTNEPQSRTEEMDDPEKNVPVEAVTTEYVQEPEVLPSGIEETVKENRTKEGSLTDLLVITESTEMGKATLPLSEGALEPVDHSKTEWVQEPEQLQAEQPSRLDSKAGSPLIEHILSDDITAVAPFTEVHTLKADVTMELEEEQPVETSETEFVQEQEVLPPDAKDNAKKTKPEEHTSMCIYVVTETTVPTPDADNTIVSVTDTIEREVVAQFDKAAEKSYGHMVIEQEVSIPEVTEELQAIPQVHVSSVDDESKLVQVQEETIIPEEIQDPAVDNAKMQDEFKHEVHLSAVQVSVEKEKESELSSTAINNAALQHAKVTQVATCDMKKVSAPIPDLLPDKTLYITEPLIDRVASQEVFGGAKTTKPSVKDDTVTAEQYTVIQSVHVPSEFEGNHKIQMQVVDADLKSAGTIVDNVLDVGVTETKEVTDYCPDTMKTVENFFATPEIEKEFTHEETKINVQVIPCVPEKVSESAVTILEQAIIKQPDALTAMSDLAASESNQIGNQKVIKDGTGTLTEKDEKSFVLIDDSAIAQQVSVDLTNPQDLPFGLNVSIGSHKEKLQQTKAKQSTSEAGVIVREVKALPEDSDVEEESVQTVKPIIPTQSTGSEKQINSTEANVPAKEITGPDSLLVLTERAVITTQPVPLDVAIETEQLVTKSQTPQSPTKIMDCTEPVKQMDVLEDGSQEIEALEPVMPIIVTQSYDSPTKTKATKVNEQPTENTKPTANFVLIERALIMTHPQILEVGMHFLKTVERVTKTSDFPPSTTDRTETEAETDVSVVEFQALKETEPAKTVIPPEREIKEQTEPSEVNNQSTEITEAVTILEPTKIGDIATHPELVGEALPSDAEDTVKDTQNEEAASIDTNVIKESFKESATIPLIDDSLKHEDSSKPEHVQEPEVKESLLGLQVRNLLPHKKESSEGFSEKETVTDECQQKTEVRDESEELLGVGIHSTELVQMVEKTIGSAPTTTDIIETSKQTDVIQVGFVAVEAVEPVTTMNITQSNENQEQTEPTEVNDQPKEITEPVANLVYRALITTQPELLDVGMHLVKTVEQVARASNSPPLTNRTETEKKAELSVVGFQELNETEPAKTVILPEREIQEQIEPPEVNNQSTEIREPATISESTERAVITTHPELLGEVLQFDAEDTVKDTTNEEAVSIDKKETDIDEYQPKTEVTDEPDELLGVGIHPTEVVELVEATTDQEQIKPTEVDIQPIEISEPLANLAERALITTQPELSDVSMHLIKTVEQATQASDSPPSTADRTETQKETDASAVGFQELKEIEPAKTVILPERKIQEQIEPSEVNNQSTETTEAAKISESTERAVVTTHPELLGEVLQFDAEDTVKDTKNEEAASIDTNQRLKESMKESATILQNEDSLEPEDPSKTENVQEPEVKESLLGLLVRNLLPQKKESSEDFSEKKAVTDECQPKTEVTDEPDELLGVGIHPTEVVELVEKTTDSATTDQELIEQTEVNIQPIEITEPVANLVERALIMTQPELSDVSMHLIKTVEQVARASDSPPSTADRTETQKETDASAVGFQELKEIEPAKTVILPERKIQEQIEPSEVNNQSTETTEAAKISESTERAVVTTHPELLGEVLQFDAEDTVKDTTNEEAVSIDTHVVKECTKERTTIHLTEGSLEPEDPSKTENVHEPEVKESLLGLLVRNLLPQKKESSEDFSEKEAVTDECQPKTEVRDEPEELLGVGIRPTEVVELVEKTIGVNYLPIEISEPVTNLVERALITTQPELSDVSMHLIETKSLLETNVSKVVIHVEEAVESEMAINSTQRAESQEDPELTETEAQATEVTEPTVNIVIPAVVTTNPALLDNGIHPAATVELVSNVQANELMQSASQTEERKVFRGEPVHSEDCDQETKANVNNTEEENDQDVWMDAEEVIYNQEGTEVSPLEVEEPEEEPEPEVVHEEPARLEESVLAFNISTEEEESQHKGYKRGETCEIESEGEDFAIALEHQEYATTSITTLEWD